MNYRNYLIFGWEILHVYQIKSFYIRGSLRREFRKEFKPEENIVIYSIEKINIKRSLKNYYDELEC